MAAVGLSLVGAGLRWETIVFAGWFGPRGLASVVFLLMAKDALEAGGVSTQGMVVAAGWTILLSVFLHGLTAGPIARWYARRTQQFPEDAPELSKEEPPASEEEARPYLHRRDRWQQAERTAEL
jgi:NhaP-type Na+/H+ or K+/H+ antiporter